MASSSSSSANTQTAFLNANLPSKKPCSICGAVVSTSNLARHKKSVKCVTTNVKPESNTNVVQSSSNNSVVVQRTAPAKPRKASCSNCGALVDASNLPRHQRSKKCVTKHAEPASNVAQPSNNNSVVVERNTAAQPSKSSCSNCGALVNAPNLGRHQKSKKCVTKHAQPDSNAAQPTVVVDMKTAARPSKVPCPNCGAFVNAPNFGRHQKSKKCISKNAVPVQTESSNNDGLVRMGIKPAPDSKRCWVCEEVVEKSHWTRHMKSQKHKQKMNLHAGENTRPRTLEERLSKWYAFRLPTPTPDIDTLVQKYPKQKIERRIINRITNEDRVISEFVSRKPTRPTMFNLKVSSASPFDMDAIIADTTVPHRSVPCQQHPLTWTIL